jgi:hydroxymethylbilane synthase
MTEFDKTIIIGTRGSELALWQANFTKSVLEQNGFTVILKIIKTKGDQIQHLSFDKIEGKGFFTKELEEALLANEVDLAVHSCKDLPSENPEGLTIGAYSARANAIDVLLINKASIADYNLLKLNPTATVGTSSSRRKAQILAHLPSLNIKDIRGNVPTRIQKLRDGMYDAIILAAAGIERLNLDISDLVRVNLEPPFFIPAAAQGVLAFQIREKDERMHAVCAVLHSNSGEQEIGIERKILNSFNGGCQIPLAIHCNGKDTWILKSENGCEMPKRIRTEVGVDDDSINEIVSKFNKFKPKSIFISRENYNDYLFRTLESNGFEINATALLDFKAIPFSINEKYDWVFFSSKKGVDYFIKGIDIAFFETCKVAAIGKSTAQYIEEQYQLKVDFIGDVNNLSDSLAEFMLLNPNKILLPRGKHSMESVQKYLPKNVFSELIVYENKPKVLLCKIASKILIFTSPLNSISYFEHYQLDDDQQCIAIGNSTAKCLNELGINCKIAIEPTPWAIADEVFAICMGL